MSNKKATARREPNFVAAKHSSPHRLCMKWTAILLLAMASFSMGATKQRGVWFWRDSSSPYGSDAILGVPALENETLAFLGSHGVKRVYGSYGNRPQNEAVLMAAWNTKLHASGLQSQLLLSENTWIFPAQRPSLLGHITAGIVTFNQAPRRLAGEKFDGLHLDIEPQGLPGWTLASPAEKRGYLLQFRDTLAEVRLLLVNAGLPTFPVYADLPVWFDNLPVDGGSVGWLSAADRNQWFTDISSSLTGITLMAFERATYSSINSGVAWERATMMGAGVRVALEVSIGSIASGQTWASVPNFNAMMETLEVAYGPAGAVDIQSYSQWRNAVAAQPILSVPALLLRSPVAAGGEVTFAAEAGWTYLVDYSADLCNWQEVARLRPSAASSMMHPVLFSQPQGFWKVSRFQE
jgi:hypothetical protein